MAREQTLSAEEARRVVEALIFAADQPTPPARLTQVMGRAFDTRAIREMVEALNAEYRTHNRAFEIIEIAGGFQMATRPEFRDWVFELFRHRRQERLSISAIETLAIVAYKQPILRAQVDDIRGVQAGPLLRSLMERGLVKVVGRQNVPGRPILYGTTRRFMQHFGLKSLKELPSGGPLPNTGGEGRKPSPDASQAGSPAPAEPDADIASQASDLPQNAAE